ncbi:putative RING-H2 finger protein ATL21A [Durio zibethinus]|uniref:RING-H2 finger protein ATL21A n=1 Tax=Durio zibethinus TaxID=66656 RepID=A0A6P5ZXT4_DURZI|nr:putative RING-H2 finger protein ATL21A [Durio zibethinus]
MVCFLYPETCPSLASVLLNMDILIFFSFLFPLIYAAEPCSTTKCGKNEIPIQFPFQLEGKLPENCGYPGFNLGCKSQNTIVLKLPYSGEFFVRDINYLDQQIYLYDPDNCIPKRLLSFNLSGSPFLAAFHQNYTFLNCPTQVTKSRFTTIDCLSNSTNSVLATSSMSLANSMASSCQIITIFPVPVSWPAKYGETFSADLEDDIQLTWYTPQCGDCEAEGGICGFKSNNSKEIDCFHLPKSGTSGNGLQVFKILCLSIAIPAVSCAIGIAVFTCCLDSRRRARENSTRRSTDPSAVLPQPVPVVTGLDESTIESYQKLVLGESRRIPGPNDSTCPICLSEYLSKDTIRCIPECKHCFHAECIDEWLRMNTTCPVCRNSPSAEDANSHTDIV